MSRSDRKLNVAVVGAGLIGRKHVEIAAGVGSLHAIVDPTMAAKELAAQQNCAWHSDLASYLEDHRPDGIIIATPNQMHVEQGLICVDAGIPALVEKPIADNPDDAERLVKTAEEKGVALLVGHHRRHNPLIHAARAAIENGKLGNLVAVHGQFWLRKPDDYFDVEWRRTKGAGPVYINLIHDLDLLRYLCGEIASVQAKESSVTRGFDVEDTAVITLEFASGALGTISVSDAIPAPWSWELTAGENPAYPKTEEGAYRIGGTKGALSVPDMKLWYHPAKQSWWEPIEAQNTPYDPADPLPLQFAHFLDVIDGKTEPLVSGREGLQTLRVLHAIKQAAREGGTIAVDAS